MDGLVPADIPQPVLFATPEMSTPHTLIFGI
jgi:hypothetical protein